MNNFRYKYILVFLLVAVFHSNASVHTPDSLKYYLEMAANNNPGVQSAFSLYRASLQKIQQAGAYQDPELEMGFFLQPMALVEGRQVGQIQLMQMFPWFGTQKAARSEAQYMAKMAYEQFREVRDQLWLDVYTQWYLLCRLQQQLNNHVKNKELLIQLNELALRKFSSPINAANLAGSSNKIVSGEKPSVNTIPERGGMTTMGNMPTALPQSTNNMVMGDQKNMQGMGGASSGLTDVLRIQLEMAEIDNNVESVLSELNAGKAKLNTLLNRPVSIDIELPDSIEQISFQLDEVLVKELIRQQNPMLRMYIQEESAYVAKAEMDKKMSYPMFGVGFQYMLINSNPHATDMGAMNGKDMVMPMLSISLPLYRNKYKAQQRENVFRQKASREKYANTLNELEATLYSLKNNLDNAARKIGLYRKQTELAQTTYDLLINEFASTKGDLTNVIQVQRQLLDYQLKTAEAVAEYNTMVAGVQKIISSTEE